MRRKGFSYPVSLAVVIATLIAVTGGWIAWWNYREGVRNVRALAAQVFEQTSRTAAGGTQAFLHVAPPAAATLAAMAEADAADPLPRLLAVLRANPTFTWVSFSTYDGEFLGVHRTAAGAIEQNHSRIADGKTITDEARLQADGTWTITKHDEAGRYDPRARPFFQLAIAAPPDQGAWTPPYVFAEQVPGITYARRVVRDGKLAGVLTIDFDLGRLSALVKELRFGAHGKVAIVAQDGTVLAHPTAPLIASGALVPAAMVADPALGPAIAAGAETAAVDVGGETYLARAQSIGEPEGTAPWKIVTYALEADFTGAMRGRMLTSLAISGIALVLALVVALLLARSISGPLTRLAADMGKVGELRLDADAAPRSSPFREIQLMIDALSRMKGGLRSFARYVPRDLVRTLLAKGHDADLSGEVKELTIYFSDLAGFTSLSETRAPDELVQFLSQYFDDMSSIIASQKGTVDKYMGDGIMAFWGAPLDVDNAAARACEAALKCQARVRELSAQGVSLATRIGVATGKVLVGNIGSTERINYTVMGDTANLASRLEGLNKQYGTYLMISEATYEQAKDQIVARPVDVVAVKGKKQGVRVYELMAMKADEDPDAEAIAAASARALDAYLARRFADAIAAWDEVLALRANDKAASVMRERAQALLASPPPDGWSGVTIATEK